MANTWRTVHSVAERKEQRRAVAEQRQGGLGRAMWLKPESRVSAS